MARASLYAHKEDVVEVSLAPSELCKLLQPRNQLLSRPHPGKAVGQGRVNGNAKTRIKANAKLLTSKP